MEKAVITFKGLSRTPDTGIAEDGYMAELINARVSDGSIVPVGKPTVKQRFDRPYDRIFKHTGSGFENLVCTLGNDLYAYVRRDGEEAYREEMILSADSTVRSLESIGNTLSAITDGGIVYLLFRDGRYYNIGGQPKMPLITFSLENESEEWSENNYLQYDGENPDETGNGNYVKAALRKALYDGLVGQAIYLFAKASEKGLLVSPVIVRYAVKLYDGSYIRHSPPVLVLPPEKDTLTGKTTADIQNDDLKGFDIQSSLKSYGLNYKVHDSRALLEWKDIILGIDLFISKPVSLYDTARQVDEYDQTYILRSEVHAYKYNDGELMERIRDTSTFYYVKTIPASYNGEDGTLSEEGLLHNLEQRDTLPDDDYTNTGITGGASYVYNARLHLGNITKKLFGGYDFRLFSNSNKKLWGESPDRFTASGYVLVSINTNDGTKTVKSDFSTISTYGITPYLTYPDIRAVHMTIVVGYPSAYRYREFPLKPHPFLNIAYSLEGLNAITLEGFKQGEPAYKTDDAEKNSNVVRVSEVNNPFYFPAKNTYSPSAFEVRAMCSNTAPVSTGQFGQYPLYVFCADGIYSLSADAGGATTYQSGAPVSRDVCTNPDVCPLDSAVAFITGAGVMAISGGSVTLLSHVMDGPLSSMLETNDVFDRILNTGKLSNSRSAVTFRDFIKGAAMGFMYEERELIVSNPGYDYCYVYSFARSGWHKISQRTDYFVKAYPECWGVSMGETSSCIYNMYNPGEGVTSIALITRPVTLGAPVHKRLWQSSLRSLLYTSLGPVTFRGEPVLFRGEELLSFGRAGFYVLGSNDGEHFVVIGGKDNFLETRDIITKMNRSRSYRYFAFCVAGSVRTISRINNLELIFDTSFTNRLR